MNNKTKFILAVVATIGVFAILTLIFWEFMRDTIVLPVYYLIWVGDLTLKSVSQEVYLAILMLISLVIGSSALQNLPSREMIQHQRQTYSMDSARYFFWRRLYDSLTANYFSRNHFALEARKLILAILAYQEDVDVASAEDMVIDGRLRVPEAVSALIRQRKLQDSGQTLSTINTFTFRLRRLLFKAELPADPQLDRQVREIVEFIEQRLEITHVTNPPES
jgi:hypothetical protein